MTIYTDADGNELSVYTIEDLDSFYAARSSTSPRAFVFKQGDESWAVAAVGAGGAQRGGLGRVEHRKPYYVPIHSQVGLEGRPSTSQESLDSALQSLLER